MMVRLLLLTWVALALSGSTVARAQQTGAPAGPIAGQTGGLTAGLTPAEAQRALDVLQDPQKRAQLVETLRVIAKASAPAGTAAETTPAGSAAEAPPAAEQPAAEKAAAEKPAVTLVPDSVGAQVVSRLANWPQRLAEETAAAVRSMPDFMLLWGWIGRMVDDPVERGLVLDAAWQIALVLGGALLLERFAAYALRRWTAKIAARAPDPDETTAAPDNEAWQRLRRMPFAAARLMLELIPAAIFWMAGSLLAGLAPAPLTRLAILVAVNAYATIRVVLAVGRMLLSPSEGGLRLLRVDDDRAAHLMRWLRRIALVAVFGGALVRLALVFGLHPGAADTLIRLVGLIVAALLAVMVLQLRQSVAVGIRAEPDDGAVAPPSPPWRGWLASGWHYLALFAIAAGWTLWAVGLDGAAGGLWLVIGSAAIVVAARLVALVGLGMLDRALGTPTEPPGTLPGALPGMAGMAGRATRYLGMARRLVNGLIAVITAIVLLQFWGIGVFSWFEAGAIGSRLLSALITIAVAVVAAIVVWEGANAALERRLARFSEAGTPAHAARLRTLLPMLRAALLVAIVAIVGLTALSQIGVNIAPLLAGAGIVGIAVGFGSQKLVQDVVTGMFVLFENAVQVGDWITVSGLSGKVEQLSVRNIWLRGGDGALHIVPFSAVSSITNTNRGLGTAAVSVTVAYSEDSDQAAEAMRAIAAEMREEPEYAAMILGDLLLWVDSVRALGVTLAGIIPCTDAGRWPVQREFNRRLQRRFKELGIGLGLRLGDA